MRASSLKDVNLYHKTVLVRVDLNLPMKEGKVSDTTRLRSALPTLHYLKEQQAKIVLLSHRGRPKGHANSDDSLVHMVEAVKSELGEDISFYPEVRGPGLQDVLKHLKPGEVLLLENLRFHAEEEANTPSFVEELAGLGNFYVNEAFSCSHREHASIVGLPKKLPSAMGFGLQKEIQLLERYLLHPQSPEMAIIGGSKASTKLSLLSHLMPRFSSIFLGGAMAHTFLIAKNISIGSSLYEPNLVEKAKELLARAEKDDCELILPVDGVIAQTLTGETSIVDIDKIPENYSLYDIGPKTVALIEKKIASVRTIIWNGPMGVYEVDPFHKGSKEVALRLAERTKKKACITIAGGGDVISAIAASGVTQDFTYICTAGGAFLEWFEGKSLPGIEALKK